jgi:hypothetical protein
MAANIGAWLGAGEDGASVRPLNPVRRGPLSLHVSQLSTQGHGDAAAYEMPEVEVDPTQARSPP